MSVKVEELMRKQVMKTTPSKTAGHLRAVMSEQNISCMPVVDPEDHAVGMVTTSDLIGEIKDSTPCSEFMSRKIYAVPEYEDVSIAARMMRNHHLHHLIVTREKKVIGILSSFDLLKLVENHRFVMKNPPTQSKRKGGKRKKEHAPPGEL